MANQGARRTLDASADVLTNAYTRSIGDYVAFLDESFELDEARETFYLVSAVVTHRDKLGPLRSGLQKVVGGTYWHTTERLRSEPGRQQTIEVAKYLGGEDGTEVGIVSYRTPVGPGGGDAAREACLAHVASLLCAGKMPLEGRGGT